MSGWDEQKVLEHAQRRAEPNYEKDRLYRVTRANRARSGKPRQHPERDLQKACEDLLQLDGWRIFRLEQNFSEKKQKSVGESGAPDGLYIRYPYTAYPEESNTDTFCDVMFIEWKSSTGKAKQHQKDWHAQERSRGALVVVAGEDFKADKDSFVAWYRGSGLMRRAI